MNDALAMLEDDEELVENIDSLTIFLPDNATGDQTDEDSGDEDFFKSKQFSRSPTVEINLRETDGNENEQTYDVEDGWSSEDETPLSVLLKRLDKTQKKPEKNKKTTKNLIYVDK